MKLEIGEGIEMKNIAIVVVFTLFATGCVTRHELASSAIPGCSSNEIQTKNHRQGWSQVTFQAVCKGKTYSCLMGRSGHAECSFDGYDESSNSQPATSKEPEEVQPEAEISVTQAEDTEAVSSSAQEIPESTQASSSSSETSDQATEEDKPLAFTPPRSSKDSEWVYTATDDTEIEQFFGLSYTLIEKHLIHRRIADCIARKADFSSCRLKAVKGPDQSHSMVEIREADGLSVIRSHGFDERNYQGTKVYVSGASKFLLAAIDQQVRRIKARRLDLQVLLETPNSGEAIIWFGSDLKALERSLSDG